MDAGCAATQFLRPFLFWENKNSGIAATVNNKENLAEPRILPESFFFRYRSGKVVQVNGTPVLGMPIQMVPAIQFIMDLKNKTRIDTVQNILISVAVKLISNQIRTILSFYEVGRIKMQKDIRFTLRDPDEVFRQHTSRFQTILVPQFKPEPDPLELHIGMDREKKILWFGFGENKG